MPRTTKTTTTSKPKKAKMISVSFQRPSALAETVKLPQGSTIKTLMDEYNVTSKGYIFSANGNEVNSSYELQPNDLVRVGIKTKDN